MVTYFLIVWATHCSIISPYATLKARFLGPTWGPSGADRTQMGPMLAPWTLLSGYLRAWSLVDVMTSYLSSIKPFPKSISLPSGTPRMVRLYSYDNQLKYFSLVYIFKKCNSQGFFHIEWQVFFIVFLWSVPATYLCIRYQITFKNINLCLKISVSFRTDCTDAYILHTVKAYAGLIIGLHPATERHRYKLTPILIGWMQT